MRRDAEQPGVEVDAFVDVGDVERKLEPGHTYLLWGFLMPVDDSIDVDMIAIDSMCVNMLVSMSVNPSSADPGSDAS